MDAWQGSCRSRSTNGMGVRERQDEGTLVIFREVISIPRGLRSADCFQTQ